MNEEEITRSFNEMWTNAIANYALVKSDHSPLGYTIMDTLFNNMVIIEEDEIAKYVIERMLENGVRVVDKFEKVRNLDRPGPIFYTPELEAQYKKWKEKQIKKKKGSHN